MNEPELSQEKIEALARLKPDSPALKMFEASVRHQAKKARAGQARCRDAYTGDHMRAASEALAELYGFVAWFWTEAEREIEKIREDSA